MQGSNIKMNVRLKGRNDIHVSVISRSYRIRGMVARTLIKAVAVMEVLRVNVIKLRVLVGGLYVVSSTVNIDINRILVYSDMKMSANILLEYSVLNPDTNSLSPSARSNGVRFVSARSVVNQINNRGGVHRKLLNGLDVNIVCKLNDVRNISNEIKIKAILTSYEIVCATLRNAPRREYFELDDHPLIMVVYTLRLEIHRNIRTP